MIRSLASAAAVPMWNAEGGNGPGLSLVKMASSSRIRSAEVKSVTTSTILRLLVQRRGEGEAVRGPAAAELVVGSPACKGVRTASALDPIGKRVAGQGIVRCVAGGCPDHPPAGDANRVVPAAVGKGTLPHTGDDAVPQSTSSPSITKLA